MGAEWGFDVPAMPPAYAYALCCIDTPFWVMLDGQAPLQLQPGDSALLLHGAAYRMGSSPTSECVDLREYWAHHNLPVLTPSSRQGAPISGLALGSAAQQSNAYPGVRAARWRRQQSPAAFTSANDPSARQRKRTLSLDLHAGDISRQRNNRCQGGLSRHRNACCSAHPDQLHSSPRAFCSNR
ncbi:hypothetical protein D9M69_546370 [compost metagenome]